MNGVEYAGSCRNRKKNKTNSSRGKMVNDMAVIEYEKSKKEKKIHLTGEEGKKE